MSMDKIKTYVITGASSGIGEALAYVYGSRGQNVVLAARSRAEIERVAASCERAGGKALALPTDVVELEQCRALVDKAVERFGGVDVLVNNAGISMSARFDQVTDMTIFERIMRVNYLGSVYCTHATLPHLKRSRGLIVAISSLTGKTGVPTRSGYAASKHAMQGFFDSLRIELARTGVDVLVASPGFVKTGIRDRVLGPDGKPRTAGRRDTHDRDTMSLAECTRILARAIDRRDREVVMTASAKIGMWVKLVAPDLVDRISMRAMRERT
ncbi:MAG: SDR family oxidoreductase [Myxococcota bacterium]|nr:SDR family oxidoreductase [Myxococcota bacterium]